MESRRRRRRSQLLKWGCYGLGLLICTVLQTCPGLFQLGQAKPLYLLPLCLAVASFEGEFAGALFGAVCGLMWDWTAGRTVGLLALALMMLAFGMSVAVQLFLKCSTPNFVLVSAGCALLLLLSDFMFFYVMPGYVGAAQRVVTFILPCAVLTGPVSAPLFWLVRRINAEFAIDTGAI